MTIRMIVAVGECDSDLKDETWGALYPRPFSNSVICFLILRQVG